MFPSRVKIILLVAYAVQIGDGVRLSVQQKTTGKVKSEGREKITPFDF